MAAVILSEPATQYSVQLLLAGPDTTLAFDIPPHSQGDTILVVATGTWNGATVVIKLGTDAGRYGPAKSYTADIAETLDTGNRVKGIITWSGGDANTDVIVDIKI